MSRLKSWMLKFKPWKVAVNVATVVAVLAVFLPWVMQNSETFLDNLAIGLLLGVLLWACTWMFVMATFTTLVFGNTMVVGDGFRILHVFIDGSTVWKWDPIRKAGNFMSYAGEREYFEMKLSPVTENPKVRHLKYSLGIVFRGTPELARQYYLRFPSIEAAQTFVKSLLYEFNEAHSKELAKFYNPLDSDQQSAFAALVTQFLVPKLAEVGITIKSAGFNDALNPV